MICFTKAADDSAACPKTLKVVKLNMRVLQYLFVYQSFVVQPFICEMEVTSRNKIFFVA